MLTGTGRGEIGVKCILAQLAILTIQIIQTYIGFDAFQNSGSIRTEAKAISKRKKLIFIFLLL